MPHALPRRPYGPAKIPLSIIGFGGIIVMNELQADADAFVAEAVRRGVNYFDVAPSYGDAEERLGPALEPFRDQIFLACKSTERTREGVEREMERSLKRLRTDHFDLYQLHAITEMEEDLKAAFAKGGAMEAILAAREAGLVNHIGFSAHSAEVAIAAMERFEFDSALYPVNFNTFHQNDLTPRVVETAKERGVTLLALKALARHHWPESVPKEERHPKCWYQPITDRHEADLALRFTLGQAVTAAIPPGDVDLFHMACDIAEGMRPLSSEENRELEQLSAAGQAVFDTV